MKDTKLRDILTSYERKRDEEERKLEQRKNQVYKQIPRIKEIEDEINKIGLEMIKLVLKNPSHREALSLEAKEKIQTLTNEKKYLLEKNSISKGYLDIKYECDLCKDRGFLSDGKKCNCLKQQIINELYKMSNLSNILEKQNKLTFDASIFSDEIDPHEGISPRENILNISNYCNKFINEFDKDNDINLLFYGDTGLGKTFMSSYIAKEILDKGYTVIYQTSFKMFDIIKDYQFRSADSNMKKDDYESLFECDLLIIDDLGMELTNTFTVTELFTILNTRLLNSKKTIISTNLHPAQLGEVYTERIFSRIFDKFKMLKFFGYDLRWQNKIASINKK